MKSCYRLPNTHFQEAHHKWQFIEADPDDGKFAGVALMARADYPATNDRHFEVFKQLALLRVLVLTLQGFLTEFQ